MRGEKWTIALLLAAISPVILYAQYLMTWNGELIAQKNAAQDELKTQREAKPNCEQIVVVEKSKDYKALFDQCTQEKISIGAELEASMQSTPPLRMDTTPPAQ